MKLHLSKRKRRQLNALSRKTGQQPKQLAAKLIKPLLRQISEGDTDLERLVFTK
jgi:hypothetical protein